MHLAPLIQDLAVILGVAAIVTYIFRLIKQPVVLGYIVAGIIVGPYTPPIFSVVDVESVKVWAELGVIFLMFSLGLEFSFRRLVKVGVSAGVTAILQILTMIILGNVTARLLGWSSMDAIFLGCMIAISSTTIIIKALEELGLKTRRFAELVFGILIVEDLAAIIMLVALSNIASKSTVSGADLLGAGGKLALVVGAWLVVGMFVVPRLIRAVGRKGNNEMLVVFSLGLCLALVSLSAYFHYSVALGAFIMGSILAETQEVHRIEELVGPLKDIFGAVFFVSVGMLLDPNMIVSNFGPILLISLVIIFGKILSVAAGTLLTGQSISTAVHAGLSMAQIGEFSFIIATLGLSYNAIQPDLYPMIVAASLLTTFTTPYLIKWAMPITEALRRRITPRMQAAMDQYGSFLQRRSSGGLSSDFYVRALRWGASMVVVLSIFVIAASQIYPWMAKQVDPEELAQVAAWLVSFVVSAPFIWSMLTAFSNQAPMARVISRILTGVVLALVSLEYFSLWIILVSVMAVALGLIFVFRRRFETYYSWFEEKFVSGMEQETTTPEHAHLVPWDAHLAEITVGPRSPIVGQTLLELSLRERFGMNVVVIQRGDFNIVAPKAHERLYPEDVILCFGTDAELERFENEMIRAGTDAKPGDDLSTFALWPFEVMDQSRVMQRSIRESGIRENYDSIVVGVERDGQRMRSPKSDLVLQPRDLLWIVGDVKQLNRLKEHFQRA